MEMLMSLITAVSILSMVPASESSCVNLQGTLSCLDFNCSMSWDTVANSEPGSQVIYSLYYAKTFTAHDVVQHWEPIEGCINVSSTSCSVRALFKDDDDFRGFKRFRIAYITNGTEACRGRKFQRDPLKSVILSAPPITHIEVTFDELSFQLIYPTDNHYPGLDLQLLRQFVNHKYQVSVREYDTNITIRNYVLKHDLSRIQRIYDLVPATRYIIRVRSAVFPPTVWGPATSIEVVRTLEKPPSMGPHDLKLVNSSFSCAEPDQREIVIKWKAVDQDHWNGDLLFYEVRAILWESRDIFTSRTVNRSYTTVSLKGLSRWEDYDVVVFANNSAGGTRNTIPLQLKRHVVDERGSQPRSLSVSADQEDKTVIEWQPSEHYPDCVMGYRITWTDDQGRKYHVIESENTWLDVEGHVMKVQVTPLLRKDYRSNQNGIALIYSNNVHRSGSGFNLWFLLLVGVVVLILVVTVLLIAKWKYIKLRWLKPQFKDNFNLEHNKVLKPAFDRQVSYEPCHRNEKEVFDAPSPGVHSPHELPPWSPNFIPSPRYEHEIPLMASLLQQGLTMVDDIDEIDLALVTHESLVEANSKGTSKHRGSETSSKSDSAIDTLSSSDVEDGEIAPPLSSSDDGYIAHDNLQEHIQAIDPINDYTQTGVSGYVPLSSSLDSSTGSDRKVTRNSPDASSSDDYVTEEIGNYTVAGVSDSPSFHDSPTTFGGSVKENNVGFDQTSNVPQNKHEPGDKDKAHWHPSGLPGKAQKVVSPYVPHSEVMQYSSSCSDRSGEDIADYSKQTIATNHPTNNQNQTHPNQGNALKHDKQYLGKQTKHDNTPSMSGLTKSQDEETVKSLQRERANVLSMSEEIV